MANRFFNSYKQACMRGQAPDLLAANLRLLMVDLDVQTPNTSAGGDEFLSDILPGARLGLTAPLTGVTVQGAVLDADDPALPDAGGGATVEALVLLDDTGDEQTSRLIALIDSATGLPLILDGTQDILQFDAAGICAL